MNNNQIRVRIPDDTNLPKILCIPVAFAGTVRGMRVDAQASTLGEHYIVAAAGHTRQVNRNSGKVHQGSLIYRKANLVCRMCTARLRFYRWLSVLSRHAMNNCVTNQSAVMSCSG